MISKQTQCDTCIMDTSAPEIVFTRTGCNFCDQARRSLKEIKKIKYDISYLFQKGDYDSIIGLSGGVDSSYTLLQAVNRGFRPLAFTVDTGYNKPEADENIMKLVEGLKVPFYRYTIDLKKFKELQSAFIKSGVKNIEIPTDHILMATTYEMADKYGIKTILSGGNVATESIMPVSWGHNARDLTQIKDIYKKMTGKRLTGLPVCSIWKWNYYRWFKKIKIRYLLDLVVDYDRKKAEKELIKRFKFVSTGNKHEENYFTWWFQSWYLFEKWGIDKRKAHLSSMIVSGQITRKKALNIIYQNPIYPEFGFEKRVLKYKKHEHSDYKMDKWYDRISWLVKKYENL